MAQIYPDRSFAIASVQEYKLAIKFQTVWADDLRIVPDKYEFLFPNRRSFHTVGDTDFGKEFLAKELATILQD